MGRQDDRLLFLNFFHGYLSELTVVQFISALSLAAFFVASLLRKKRRFRVLRLACYTWYGAVVFSVTLFGRSPACAVNSVDALFTTWQGLFKPDNYISVFEIIYNILLFLPLGFIFADCGYGKKKAVLLTFFTSLGIETAQLVTGRGVFEICDLAHNTLGGYFGALLYPVSRKIWQRFRKWRDRSWQTGKITEK